MAKNTNKGRKNPTPAKKAGNATKAAAGKPGRVGGSHVDFGLHGMTHIMQKVREAGLESELSDALGQKEQFVKVQRKTLAGIKNFVGSKPELAGLASEMGSCDCPPDDPYCIYI